jgi:hypothetical protein
MTDPLKFQEVIGHQFPIFTREQSLPLNIYEGWYPIVEKFLVRLHEMYLAAPHKDEWLQTLKILAIKEKFGTLRVYFHAPISRSQRLELLSILDAAAKTCELCGQPGMLRKDSTGWSMRTRCDEHYKQELLRQNF